MQFIKKFGRYEMISDAQATRTRENKLLELQSVQLFTHDHAVEVQFTREEALALLRELKQRVEGSDDRDSLPPTFPRPT